MDQELKNKLDLIGKKIKQSNHLILCSVDLGSVTGYSIFLEYRLNEEEYYKEKELFLEIDKEFSDILNDGLQLFETHCAEGIFAYGVEVDIEDLLNRTTKT
jgi:hypothetical protein